LQNSPAVTLQGYLFLQKVSKQSMFLNNECELSFSNYQETPIISGKKKSRQFGRDFLKKSDLVKRDYKSRHQKNPAN